MTPRITPRRTAGRQLMPRSDPPRNPSSAIRTTAPTRLRTIAAIDGVEARIRPTAKAAPSWAENALPTTSPTAVSRPLAGWSGPITPSLSAGRRKGFLDRLFDGRAGGHQGFAAVGAGGVPGAVAEDRDI